MKVNEKTLIVGRKVLLVPYEKHHVPKYHKWMESEELQQLTASERLSLEEEFNMQQNWRLDEDKCTFIILSKNSYEASQSSGRNTMEVEVESMVGDVNLFIMEKGIAEVEIMIADQHVRGQGLGKEALCTMMRYGMETLGIKKFVAKIGLQNQPSIYLFSTLGFAETSRSEVFKETTMELIINEESSQLLSSYSPNFALKSYDHGSV